jgi:hypothetical protein
MSLQTEEPKHFAFLRDYDVKLVAAALDDIVRVDQSRPPSERNGLATLNAYFRLMQQDLSVPILRAAKPETIGALFSSEANSLDGGPDIFNEDLFEEEWWMSILKGRLETLERREQKILGNKANIDLLLLHLPDETLKQAFGKDVGNYGVLIDDILFINTAEMGRLISKLGPTVLDATSDQPHLLEHVKLKSMDHWQELAEAAGHFGDRKELKPAEREQARAEVTAELKQIFLDRYA